MEHQNENCAGGSLPVDGEWEAPLPFHEIALPTFPDHALPHWLRTFVLAVAEATQTPVDLAALVGLAVCAAASAKKVKVSLASGYFEPLNLFVVVVMPPGSRKSSVFQTMVRPLREAEAEAVLHARSGIAEAMSRLRIAQIEEKRKEEKAARSKALKERNDLVEEATQLARQISDTRVPAEPRLLADDTTAERLSSMLAEQEGRLAILSPEGDVFDIMAGRYSANGAPNFGVYLRAHCGDDIRIDRMGRPAEFVSNPALTIGLTVQHDVIDGLFQKPRFRGRGLTGRFLYSLPLNLLGHRKNAPLPVPNAIRLIYNQRVRALNDLPFNRDSLGNISEHILRLSPEALQLFLSFRAWLEPKLGPFAELGHMTDWAGKLAGAVARLAGNIHMAASDSVEPWLTPISGETVENAIVIGKYLIPHAQAAYGQMGADPIITDAKCLLTRIKGKFTDAFTKRDIFNETRGRFKTVEALGPVLQVLIDHGYIRPRTSSDHPGVGRKPSTTYEVNPLWPAQITQNPQKGAVLADSAHSVDVAYALDLG